MEASYIKPVLGFQNVFYLFNVYLHNILSANETMQLRIRWPSSWCIDMKGVEVVLEWLAEWGFRKSNIAVCLVCVCVCVPLRGCLCVLCTYEWPWLCFIMHTVHILPHSNTHMWRRQACTKPAVRCDNFRGTLPRVKLCVCVYVCVSMRVHTSMLKTQAVVTKCMPSVHTGDLSVDKLCQYSQGTVTNEHIVPQSNQ